MQLIGTNYTGRKISASLGYVTVRGDGTMGRARGEQDALCAIASPLPIPRLSHVQEVEEKYIQNEHLVAKIAEELVIILESSDSDMSEEDEHNSLEGILPFSPDSE
jgi:hypothetical protein